MKRLLDLCSIFMAIIASCFAVLVCFILLVYPSLNKNNSTQNRNTAASQATGTNNVIDEAIPVINYQDNSSIGEELSPLNNISDNSQTTGSAHSSVEQADSQDTNIPSEYNSALNKAETYSNTMYMSKAAIYDQLISQYGENFSPEAAQYAMDNINADWNSNALQKAKDYSDTMYLSKAAIYDQLISEYGEKFAPSEAQYAIDNLDADYNSNALQKARDYQNTMDMSPSAIHDQLTSEYGEKFTSSEADYAISNLN